MSEKTVRVRALRELNCQLGQFRVGREFNAPADLAARWAKDGAVELVKAGSTETAEEPKGEQTAEAPKEDPPKPRRRAPKK